MDAAPTIADLLGRMATGDNEARHAVLAHFYDPMRQLARTLLRQEAGGCSLESKDLVHEAVLSKFGGKLPALSTPNDFMALARYLMRQIVVDRGRRRTTRRRYFQTVQPSPARALPREMELAVESEFRALAAMDPVSARIVLCREVEHLTWEETSKITGVPVRTARDHYKFALGWLRSRLKK